MYLYKDHSARTSFGKEEGVDEKSNKKWHRKDGVQSEKRCPYPSKHFFSETQSLCLLGFSWSPDNIKVSNRAYQYIWNNHIIFAQKYYNFTTLSMWVVYATCVPKNSIVSQDMISYLLWYNVIHWSSHICRKTSFL